MKLFQSIFGGSETIGNYPESLVEMATERAVDGTDSRLRLVPRYRKRLRKPVIEAIDSDDKKRARLNIITHLLANIPYKKLPRKKVELPKRQKAGGYREPDYPFKIIPEAY